MTVDTTTSGPTPGRSDVIPESYAVHVTPERGHVWQYRASSPEPADSAETLDRNADPKLPMAHAPSMPPTPEGYCSYSRTYQCELDCE